MSDRLTSQTSTRTSSPLELAHPAALLLVTGIRGFELGAESLSIKSSPFSELPSVEVSIFLGLFAFFALQCGGVLRGMLPEKAPLAHKAFAMTLGALGSMFVLQEPSFEALVGWTLATAAWNFASPPFLYSIPAKIMSGLCLGFACVWTPSAAPLVLSMSVLLLVLLLQEKQKNYIPCLAWVLGLLVGLSAYWTGQTEFPSIPVEGQNLNPSLGAALLDPLLGVHVAFIPFFLLGIGVAVFQSKRTFYGLLFPLLIGLPLFNLYIQSGHAEVLELPTLLLIGYGCFRLVRGVEQGVRNSASKKANAVFPIATLLVLLGATLFSVTTFF